MKVVAIVDDVENEFPVVEEEEVIDDYLPTEEVVKVGEEEEGDKVQEPLSLAAFTDEYLQHMNNVLSSQPLSSVLQWCYHSLPNFFQVTSFGSAGMVVIHELHKLNLNVCYHLLLLLIERGHLLF